MTRLPTPGSDDGTWGDILNDFLEVSHGADGSLNSGIVGTTQLQDGAVTNTKLDSPTQASLASANSAVQQVNGKTGPSVTLAASDVSAIPSSQLGAASGVATLDTGSHLTASQLPGSVTTMSSAELTYWQDRAALLDPAAYQLYSGASFSASVPSGKRWYARNVWGAQTNDSRTDTGGSVTSGSSVLTDPSLTSADAGRMVWGSGIPSNTWLLSATAGSGVMSSKATATNGSISVQVFAMKYIRDPSISKAQLLPASETLTGRPDSAQGYAYICQPELVIPSPYGGGSDQRYITDPKALYYSRLQTLQTLTPSELTAVVPPGSAAGTTVTAAFPGGFTNGIILGYSLMQSSWAGLYTGGFTVNLWHEVSDSHEMRVAFDNILLPFQPTTFPDVRLRGASTPGNLTTVSGGGQGGSAAPFQGQCTVRYFQLTEGW